MVDIFEVFVFQIFHFLNLSKVVKNARESPLFRYKDYYSKNKDKNSFSLLNVQRTYRFECILIPHKELIEIPSL